MNINLAVKYLVDDKIVCFKHAVLKSLEGKEVKTDVDDFDNEQYLGSLECTICHPEIEMNLSDYPEDEDEDEGLHIPIYALPTKEEIETQERKDNLETKGFHLKKKKK